MVFRYKGVYTVQLIREHSFGYKIFTLDFELKISGHTIKLKRLDFRFMNLRFIDFLPHFGPCFCSNSILGDPGADSGGEGKSKQAEKYGTKET